jgi:hypothetical protein
MDLTEPIAFRYIKLGPKGVWTERSLRQGEIHFGHRRVPHELALTGDREAVTAYLIQTGRSPGKARDFAREIIDFYTLGFDTVWITFAHRHLWWTKAHPDVIWLGEGDGHGVRMRRTLAAWRQTDLLERPLSLNSLSTKLTKVGAYRQTLCRIEAQAYLLTKLKGEDDPIVARGKSAREQVLAVAEDAIAALHWADFETLLDLIFARSGWQRISELGGTQKDVDLVVGQAATNERAFVQIKSSATQAVLDDYLTRYEESPYQRLFFICHSPHGSLTMPDRPDLHLWTRPHLAEAAVRAGLFDWLMERTG